MEGGELYYGINVLRKMQSKERRSRSTKGYHEKW